MKHELTSVDCPVCGTRMSLTNVPDIMKCPKCGNEIDRCEDGDGY